MRRLRFVAVIAFAALLAGCGGGGSNGGQAAGGSPSYKQLSSAELTKALLTISDMPPGYSATSSGKDSSSKFCGYAPDHAPLRPRHDFQKGGGFSTQIAAVQLSQYPSEQVASQNLDRLRTGLKTCKSEVSQGDHVRYSVMSTPNVGHPTLGLRIDGPNYTVLENIAQVGPTIVLTGTGGITSADADLAGQLLKQQISRYEDAAKQ